MKLSKVIETLQYLKGLDDKGTKKSNGQMIEIYKVVLECEKKITLSFEDEQALKGKDD